MGTLQAGQNSGKKQGDGPFVHFFKVRQKDRPPVLQKDRPPVLPRSPVLPKGPKSVPKKL